MDLLISGQIRILYDASGLSTVVWLGTWLNFEIINSQVDATLSERSQDFLK